MKDFNQATTKQPDLGWPDGGEAGSWEANVVIWLKGGEATSGRAVGSDGEGGGMTGLTGCAPWGDGS